MKRELVAYTDPTSSVSEMFKTLRTNIQFMNTNKELKTLLVSSTLPGEGKSWTTANLAVSFAQAGKKVLLVDADMRKGRQFNIFEVNPTPGLSNYLSGVLEGESRKCELQDVLQGTEVENLSIITSGIVPPNPSELLVSERMLELNSQVKEMFDITIFDGTPSLLVTDAPILSRIADSTIIVTAHNETKIDNVEKVKKAIENVGGKVAGVVVNKIPVSASKYKNTYYYGSTALGNINEKKSKHIKRKRGQSKSQDEHFIEKFERDFDIKEFENNEFVQEQTEENNEFQNENEINNNTEQNASNQQATWEEANEAYEEMKTDNTSNIKQTFETTQDVINQINKFLFDESNNINNGGNN